MSAEPTSITYVVGDATDPRGEGPKIVAHVTNNIGAWGRGFVLAISRRWPEPEKVYRVGGRNLGWTTIVEVGPALWVANMLAQRGLRSASNPTPIVYDALARCLSGLAVMATVRHASVHMPRIGCGFAGGRWEEVEPIIRETLCAAGVPVTVYDLPT